jgi:predicted HTH transcriptional regulator
MLTELIAQGEGTNLEFKSTIDSAWKIARTLAAFANTSGGTLLIGVTDEGSICGVESELSEMQKIEAAAEQYCVPPLSVIYRSVNAGGKLVLLINVAESTAKPHRTLDAQGNSAVYVRAHDQNVPAGKPAVRALEYEPLPADSSLLESKTVKILTAYLEQKGSVSSRQFAQIANISERRAGKLLHELTRQGVLLMHDEQKQAFYSLR